MDNVFAEERWFMEFPSDTIVRSEWDTQLIAVNLSYLDSRWIAYLVDVKELLLMTYCSNLWDSNLFKVSPKRFRLKTAARFTVEEKEFLFQLRDVLKEMCKVYYFHFIAQIDEQFCVEFMKARGPRYCIYPPENNLPTDDLFLQLEPFFHLTIEDIYTDTPYLDAVRKDTQ